MLNKLQPLFVGDLKINIPIIQGGMGVRVSTAALAGAVANCGGAGTIASVGLHGTEKTDKTYTEFSNDALRKEIRLAREITQGVIGVNIMVALSNYEEMVRTAVKENVDYIVSGAGLPLSLPDYTKGSSVKLIVIVSSARSANIIFKTWKRRYNRLPDAVVVEGPMAGGHLGYDADDLKENKAKTLDTLVVEILEVVRSYQSEKSVEVPVIAAGGVFDGKDIARLFKLGARGVQMGTRFVATHECPVSDTVKELYVAAGEDDVTIIKSPVGMPGRALKTAFIERIRGGEKIPFKCNYKCLRSCDIKGAPYCIARALCNALIGDCDNAVVFAGSNVVRIKEIVSVEELMSSVTQQAVDELNRK